MKRISAAACAVVLLAGCGGPIQREELGRSVEALRGRVAELTNWRRQVREHRRELIIGAAVVGFAVGGLIALRRR